MALMAKSRQDDGRFLPLVILAKTTTYSFQSSAVAMVQVAPVPPLERSAMAHWEDYLLVAMEMVEVATVVARVMATLAR